MLVFSHIMVFIENEAALLCVTMKERAMGIAASVIFDKAFTIVKPSFRGAFFKRVLSWE